MLCFVVEASSSGLSTGPLVVQHCAEEQPRYLFLGGSFFRWLATLQAIYGRDFLVMLFCSQHVLKGFVNTYIPNCPRRDVPLHG